MLSNNKNNTWARPVFFAVVASMLYAYEYAQMALFNNLYPIIQQEYVLSNQQMGHVSMLYFLGMLSVFPLVSWVLSRNNPATVLFISILGIICTTVGFASSQTCTELKAYRFLQGVFASPTYVSCLLVTTKAFQEQYRPIITGLVFATGALGGVVAQLLGQIAINKMGWRLALETDVWIGVVMLFVYALLLQAESDEQELGQEKTDFSSMLWQTINTPGLWLCAAFAACINVTAVLLGAVYGSAYLQRIHALSPEKAAFISSCLYMGVILGSVFWGKWVWYTKGAISGLYFGVLGNLAVLSSMHFINSHHAYWLAMHFIAIGVFSSSQAQVYPIIHNLLPKSAVGIGKSLVVVVVIMCACITPWLISNLQEIVDFVGGANTFEVQIEQYIVPELIYVSIGALLCTYLLSRDKMVAQKA